MNLRAKSILALLVVSFLPNFRIQAADAKKPQPPDRPNIVYIALEDITPMFGCYGDSDAKTPNSDKLAEEGVRYTHAYSAGPVCSVSRSSVVSGMYPSTIGTVNHRSRVKLPAFLRAIPEFFRDAGYYTCNNYKRDYNFRGIPWDDSSHEAHWRNRPDKKQPFFAKFDFRESHSSLLGISEEEVVAERLNRLQPEDFHDPGEVFIPPYHPDDPEFRKMWARYHDAVTQTDYRTGELIAQLKEDGLWDDTIIFVWADHGIGMPRGKLTCWEQGFSVPLIVRFPEKYRHLAPAELGTAVDDLVLLMDMGPSAMNMAGIEPPDWMQGRPLLCKGDVEKREFVVGGRNRINSPVEMVRSVRDERYRYQPTSSTHTTTTVDRISRQSGTGWDSRVRTSPCRPFLGRTGSRRFTSAKRTLLLTSTRAPTLEI